MKRTILLVRYRLHFLLAPVLSVHARHEAPFADGAARVIRDKEHG